MIKHIYGFLLGLLVMYFLTEIKTTCFIQNDTKDMLDGIIKKLVRQGARWSTAAEQDKNPLIAVLHANYGAGYLWALKDVATDKQIYSATGIDVKKYESVIIRIQDEATRKAVASCPQYNTAVTYLASIGGER